MKAPQALAVAAIATVAASGRPSSAASYRHRAAQSLTVVSGTGVEEAELPPEPSTTAPAPNYTEEQCDAWLAEAFAADADESAGLNEKEFHAFLTAIEEPAFVKEYFAQYSSYEDLPWLFGVVHKTIACRCEDLGLGEDCCEGDKAEIHFVGLRDDGTLTQAQKDLATEHRADTCNLIAVVFQEVIPTPSPTASPTTEGPTGAPTPPAPATERPTRAPIAEEAAAPTRTPTGGANAGHAFECTEKEACNNNAPNFDESTGWSSLGDCGEGHVFGDCPPAHDNDEEYVEKDWVTVPTLFGQKPAAKMLELDVVGSVIDYSSFDDDTLLKFIDGREVPYLDAAKVLANEKDNYVLRHVIRGFGQLAKELLGTDSGISEDGKRNLRTSRELQLNKLGTLNPLQVKDIKCPGNLVYAPEGGLCINFRIGVTLTSQNEATVTAKWDDFKSAIDKEGKLYEIVSSNYPQTNITGLGNPGKGIYYQANRTPTVKTKTTPPIDENDASGLPWWALVLIILALLAIPMALIAVYARRRRQEEEERRHRLAEHEAKRDLEARSVLDEQPTALAVPAPLAVPAAIPEQDDESSAASVWSESSDESDIEQGNDNDDDYALPTARTGSALAAMGAAGVAAALAPGKTEYLGSSASDDESSEDPIKAEVRTLVEETKTPRSASELMQAWSGKEQLLLYHLRTMKARQSTSVDKNLVPDGTERRVPTSETAAAGDVIAAATTSPRAFAPSIDKQQEDASPSLDNRDKIRAEVIAIAREIETPRTLSEEVLLSHLKRIQKVKERQSESSEGSAAVDASTVGPAAAAPNSEEISANSDVDTPSYAIPISAASPDESNPCSPAEDAAAAEMATAATAVYAAADPSSAGCPPPSADAPSASDTVPASEAAVAASSTAKAPEGAAPSNIDKELLSQPDAAKGKDGKPPASKSPAPAPPDPIIVETVSSSSSSVSSRIDEELRFKMMNRQVSDAMAPFAAAAALQSSSEKPKASPGVDQELLSKMQSKRAVPSDIPATTGREDKARVSSNVSEELLSKMQNRRALPEAKAPFAQQDKAKSSSGMSKELLTKMKSRRAAPIVSTSAIGQQGRAESSIRIDQELMSKMQNRQASETPPPDVSTAFKPYEKFDSGKVAKQQSSSISKMKTKEDVPQDISKIRAEVTRLVEETKPGTSAENMLKAYKGRESELLLNLRQLKGRQSSAKKAAQSRSMSSTSTETPLKEKGGDSQDLAKIRDEVESIVSETKPGKTAAELLNAFKNREEELLHNLRELRARRTSLAKTRASLDSTSFKKSRA